MATSTDTIRKAFADKLKTLKCPYCELAYTDYAVDWSEAWMEGRRDTLRDVGMNERDGPAKLKCELCGQLAMTNAFLSPPQKI